MIQIDRQTFKRLWRLVKPFFLSNVWWKAWGLLLLLGLFLGLMALINVKLSFANRDVITALSLKEQDQFFTNLFWYLFFFALATPMTVFYSYTEQRLALLWRLWLSRQLLKKYFQKLAYYRVGSYEGIDNPDQRIEEDVRTFTATTLSLFLIFCNALITLVSFIVILWSISINLILAVLAYSLLGTIITYFVGRPLISLNFAQLRKEANYRYKLVNVRDNAESIAFSRGDAKELTRTRQRLKKAVENFRRIINVNRNLNLFIVGYNYLKPVIPVIVVAPLYLRSEIEFGVITQSAEVFVRVADALSILIQNFATISNITAVVTRLGSFTEALQDVSEKAPLLSEGGAKVNEEPRIAFDKVDIMTPQRDQLLLRELSFSLERGGVLVIGPSGSGKSSIFRVISGLWSASSGQIIRPAMEHCIFLPQRPYMVLGTIRNQLLYSTARRGVPDKELLRALEEVGLEEILQRIPHGFDAFLDWNTMLSTGEQQRMAFARLLLAQPHFAFLDEATTAIDAESEELLYGLVSKITKAHMSIGYRENLAKYHHTLIELKGDGKWRIEKLKS